MAKKRKRKYQRRKKSALDYIALPKLPRFDLDPDTKSGIFIVLMLAIGAISLLSLFNLAGAMGVYLSRSLLLLFGWGKWLVPLILMVWGFALYKEDKYWIRGASYLGLLLFIISFQTLLHIFIDIGDWQEAVSQGRGGGYLGLSLVIIFTRLLGFWASLIALVCLLLISLMLIFNTTLVALVGRESWLARILYPVNYVFSRLFRSGAEAEQGADEEETAEPEEDDDEFSDGEEGSAAAETAKQIAAGFYSHKIGDQAVEPKPKIAQAEIHWKPSKIKIDLPLDLLSDKVGKPTSGDIKAGTAMIQKTLENFGIPVEMGEVSVGPTVTQYTLKPAEGIKLSRLTALNNDLSLALAAHPIRIEAPIPGKSLVGIEVPNQAIAVVGLREILSSQKFKERKSNLTIALGKDVAGQPWLADISRMPHLLVAGSTGSGKSVMLNSIIISLLYQNNPGDLRLIMVDPKRVELTAYNGIPHLLAPVITDVPQTINSLKWSLNEMDRRFEVVAKSGKRDIVGYNQASREKMPYLVFIVDELADLMVVAAREVEAAIIRLAQMARAVGIHLILSTQRPSVDIITGLIKANITSRISFAVASSVDSRTILDAQGADKLLGRGDMLYVAPELSKPKRLQGAYVGESEIKRVVNYIKQAGGEPDYDDQVVEKQKVRGLAGVGLDSNSDDDELLAEAKDVVINLGKASASLLQRRLRVGYARAARLLDLLEEAGVVGPGLGAKPREVLISQEEYDMIMNQEVSGVGLHNRETSQPPEEYFVEESAEVSEGENTPSQEEFTEEEEDINKNRNKVTAEIYSEEDIGAGEIADVEEKDQDSETSRVEEDDDEDEGKYFSR